MSRNFIRFSKTFDPLRTSKLLMHDSAFTAVYGLLECDMLLLSNHKTRLDNFSTSTKVMVQCIYVVMATF